MLDFFISSMTKNSTLIFEYWRIIYYYHRSKRESNRFIKDYKIEIKIDVLPWPDTFRLRQYSLELNKFSRARIFDIFGYSVPNYRSGIIDNANLSSEYSLSISEYWQCNKMWRALYCDSFSWPNWKKKKEKREENTQFYLKIGLLGLCIIYLLQIFDFSEWFRLFKVYKSRSYLSYSQSSECPIVNKRKKTTKNKGKKE